MPQRAEAIHELREGKGAASLWFAMLAGPVAWMIGLNADYFLVRLACTKSTMIPLHLVTVVTLALAVSGGLVAHRDWKLSGAEWPGEEGGVLGRSRFMSALGILTASFFALVIVAQWLAKLFISPCIAI
jgi:hypothetical protein